LAKRPRKHTHFHTYWTPDPQLATLVRAKWECTPRWLSCQDQEQFLYLFTGLMDF